MTVAKYSTLIWTLTSASSPGSFHRLRAITHTDDHDVDEPVATTSGPLDLPGLPLTSYLRTERASRAKSSQGRPADREPSIVRHGTRPNGRCARAECCGCATIWRESSMERDSISGSS